MCCIVVVSSQHQPATHRSRRHRVVAVVGPRAARPSRPHPPPSLTHTHPSATRCAVVCERACPQVMCPGVSTQGKSPYNIALPADVRASQRSSQGVPLQSHPTINEYAHTHASLAGARNIRKHGTLYTTCLFVIIMCVVRDACACSKCILYAHSYDKGSQRRLHRNRYDDDVVTMCPASCYSVDVCACLLVCNVRASKCE